MGASDLEEIRHLTRPQDVPQVLRPGIELEMGLGADVMESVDIPDLKSRHSARASHCYQGVKALRRFSGPK